MLSTAILNLVYLIGGDKDTPIKITLCKEKYKILNERLDGLLLHLDDKSCKGLGCIFMIEGAQ